MLLADELNARGLVAITRDERVQAFDQLHLPSRPLSRATVIKVGQLLGASEVIAGSFRLNGDELIVDAHSIRIEVGRLEPPITERRRSRTSSHLGSASTAARWRAAHGPAGARAAARRLRELHQGPARREAPRPRRRSSSRPSPNSPASIRHGLALWDVRTEQGDHSAALAAVKPVAATSPFAARAQLRIGLSLLELKDYVAAGRSRS